VWGRLGAVAVVCLALGSGSGAAQNELTCFGAPATIVGTQANDQVFGTPGPDVIVTLGGDDGVIALGGDDRICLGPGNDVVQGNDGNDSIDAGPGNNAIDGGAGDDTIVGGPDGDSAFYLDATGPVRADLQTGVSTGQGRDTLSGIENLGGSDYNDTFTGDGNINVLSGFGGNDTLDGGAHSDALDGGPGNDQLIGHPGDGDAAAYVDTNGGVNVDLQANVATGDGRDTLTNVESVLGSPHADKISGDGTLNFLMGFGGNDVLDGRGGFDIADFIAPTTASLATGQAQSQGMEKLLNFEGLAGSNGTDHLTGDGKQNFLEGYQGDDVLAGGGGPDVLFGDQGNDRLNGGAGDDKLFGGPNNDVLNGGAGSADTVSYINSAAAVHADLATKSATGDGADTLSGVESLSGSTFSDTLVGDSKPNELFGNEGDDTLSAGGGADFVGGGDGSDTVQAGAGSDYCLDDQPTRGCEITGAPSTPGTAPPPPVPSRLLAAGRPVGPVSSGPRRTNGDLLAWMARTARTLNAVGRSFERARTPQQLVVPSIGPRPVARTVPTVRETSDYEYSAEPVCISTKKGGITEIAPPNVVHPVGDDDRPEEAWWQGTLYRQASKNGPFTRQQAKTGWARAQLAGNVVLPGGVVVWKDVSGRRAFRSPVPFKVSRGRYVWKGQIYWVRSGGKVFAPVEPHIIRARTIRHNKNCDFR
jgi:Ca2+-binding RTX toxin-like protein